MLHTYTDKRKVKGTMTVMEAKRKGKKQCKENDRERKKREKDINASYLHGKWNDMFRVGRSDNVCDNQCHQNLFVTLS